MISCATFDTLVIFLSVCSGSVKQSVIVVFSAQLDAGSPEKVSLVSRDEQSVLVVSYAELKQFFEQSFTELQQAAAQSQAHTRVSGFS